MPIKERSFRIGCGRYLQEVGILKECGAEVLRLGKAPLVVGGKTALSLTQKQIEESISAVTEKYRIVEHGGSCNDERAKELAAYAKQDGYDVIVGVGGGVIMDFAKLIGHFASLPVINIPTSSATCAAYTPLSVRYTPDGRTVGSLHYEREVNAVLVDPAILVSQPPRLLLAGMFDAIAKFVEIKHRFAGDDVKDCPLGLDWAYVLSKASYAELLEKTEPCLADMRDGRVSDTVERVLFTTIATTGVISGIARGSNQTALAHKFYEATRKLFYRESAPYLHGEIVGVGLLLQNAFNGEPENNADLLSLMKSYRMPHSVSGIGVATSEATFTAYYDALMACAAITEGGDNAPQRLHTALTYLFSL